MYRNQASFFKVVRSCTVGRSVGAALLRSGLIGICFRLIKSKTGGEDGVHQASAGVSRRSRAVPL